MWDRHHQIGALFTHFRHVAFGGGGDVVHRHLALQVSLVPHRDLRRHEADVADAQRMRLAVAVFHRRIDDDVRREQRFCVLASMTLALIYGNLAPAMAFFR